MSGDIAKYLGELLKNDWEVVGYSVHHEVGEPENATKAHHALIKKGTELRAYNFFVAEGKVIGSSQDDFQTGVE